MKVAVVSAAALPSPAPSYGGLESIAAYTAEALARDHEVTLFAAQGSRTEKATLFETVPPSYEPSREWPVEGAAWRKMAPELARFDVVFDHSHAFWAWKLKLERPRIRVVKVVHDLLPSFTPPPPGSYDVLAGVSRFHAKFLGARWGVPVAHLYNGIPTERMTYRAKKQGYLLYLSRLDPGKGAHVFLDILGRIGSPPAILAGDDDPAHGIDPRYRDRICERATRMGVDYLGAVSPEHKLELIANARAMVVPLDDPYREVFGIWIVESLASGTPVFTLDKGACQELVTRQSGGVADTAENLGEGIRAFVRGDFEFDPIACLEQGLKFDIGRTGQAYRELVTSLTRDDAS
jgi:glycosyltransferase involved in cell wall biosynthesis